MLVPAATFTDFVLAVHILAAVVGFGMVFANPIFLGAGSRLEPSAMPWFFRMMQLMTKRLIYPGLLIVLICGIYLAAKEHQFHAFYVQWGFFAVIVIGAVEGAVMAPRLRTLIALSERELAGAPAAGRFSFSSGYQVALRQVSLGGAVQAFIVVLTIFLMATHAGA